MRSSRSPFRNLLRSSTKRSRESPPSAAAVPALPRSPTAGLTNQFQSISLPSNGGSHSPPKPGQLLGGTSEHSVPVEQPAAAADKPSMPAFLQLSPHGKTVSLWRGHGPWKIATNASQKSSSDFKI